MRALIALTLLLITKASLAATLSTATITADTLSATTDCIHYKVTGLCIWFDKKRLKFSTTLEVEHYLPDVVVVAYPKRKHNPWQLVNDSIDVVSMTAGNKLFAAIYPNNKLHDGWMNSQGNTNSNIRYFEADVIGHPLAGFTVGGNVVGLPILHSQATALFPYYVSAADSIAWRTPTLDMNNVGAFVPGTDEVGTWSNTWGPLYPRTGFVNQPNTAKAAGVIALRAVSIATSSSPTHIHSNLNKANCGKHCTKPGAAKRDHNTLFQIIYPRAAHSCQIMAAQSEPNWSHDNNSAYAWVVWRRYAGCIDGRGRLTKRVAIGG